MRVSRHLTVRAVVLLSLILVPLVGAPAANPKPSDQRSPAELVQAALKTELEGPSTTRDTLLKQALEVDPEFAPARWQLGFVRFDDQWLTLDEVAKRVADDKRLIEYRKRRDALVDTADNQREMARWCHKQKLVGEERIHWAKVLEFEPQDAEALTALDLQLYEGRLLTKAQIDAAKKQAAEVRRATKEWQPRLLKWRKAIEGGSSKDRLAALQELQKLSDPNVIPALEATFAEDRASKTGDERNRLLIETVGRMPFPEATQVLLRRAILPDSEEVRNAAADELKKRPMHAYVPQLIAALPGSLKTKFHIYVLPGGMVLHEHEVLIEGQHADYSLRYESIVNPTDLFAAMLTTPKAVAKALEKASAIESDAEFNQAYADSMRDRVRAILKHTTGFSGSNDARFWQTQYDEYNGWYSRKETKPVYTHAIESRENCFTARYIENHSCFPKGTPVVTMNGVLPIENIEIGDRVLSQDIKTGELSFRTVENTTVRQPTPLLLIDVGAAAITATPGHPMWVVGEGWRTAKRLSSGAKLHTIDGARVVRRITDLPPTEVYNLVVSDSHNYFVGDFGLLVHDNSPLEMPLWDVPGMGPKVELRRVNISQSR